MTTTCCAQCSSARSLLHQLLLTMLGRVGVGKVTIQTAPFNDDHLTFCVYLKG